VAVRADLRRIRPPEVLALIAGLLLAVALFLPWYEFAGVQRDAWNSLTVAELPAAAAALLALSLVVATGLQRSPALPVALAVWTTTVGFVAVITVLVRVLALPGNADERCYGLWLALAGSIGVLVAGWLSIRDERPFWGIPAGGASQR
jgi:hypothetical protein